MTIKSVCFEKEKINWNEIEKKVDEDIAKEVKEMLKNETKD